MHEFQVTLSLPVEAQNITDAIEEFRHDARYGTDYVYQVDTGEGVFDYDTETAVRTAVPRLDLGALDAAAARIYALAHSTDAVDAVQTPGDRAIVRDIAEELAKLLGLR